MKNIKKNYNLVFFIALFVIFLTSGCDINDILNDEDNNTVDEKAVEIDAKGGTITNKDLTITIPAGAFLESANITVSVFPTNNSSQDIVTETYSIEGLPDNINKPIKIELKYSGNLKEENFLVIQEPVFIESLDTVVEESNYQAATIQNGSLVGEFSEMNISPNKTIGKRSYNNSVLGNSIFRIFGISNQKSYVTANNHFIIIYNASKDNLGSITNLGQYLEDAYSKIEGLGFSFSKRTSWPIKVQIEDLASNVYGYHCTSLWGINSYYLKFNRINLNSSTKLKTTAMHEFFHFAQYLYDSRNVYSRAKFKSNQHWFNEACSVWSEELIVGSGYISDVRTSNTLTKPFEGLHAGSIGDATYHGYGMAAFVKYIVAKYGESILINIYEKILAGRLVVDAINNSINYNLFLDYNTFLQQYAQGKIYSDLGYDHILAVREGMFRIQTEADTAKSFSNNYKDLSAKIFLVRLDNQNFQDDASLNLSIDQDLCDISVFEYPKSGGELTLISKGTKNCTVTGLKNLVLEGKYLIVMVTNSNYISNNYVASSKDITLKMAVNNKSLIGIEVYVVINDTDMRWKSPNNGQADWVYNYGVSYSFDFSSGVFGIAPDIGSWSFNGNVFTGTLDNTHPDEYTQTGYMKIIFSDNPKRVSIDIDRTRNAQIWPSGSCKEHLKFTINDIPQIEASLYYEYGSTLSRAKATYLYECSTGYTEEIVKINFTGDGTKSDDGLIRVVLFYR